MPKDFSAAKVSLVFTAPEGESPAHALLVGSAHPLLAEKEPNDGFAQAQAIQVPQTVDGQIHGDGNVDVFSLSGAAGQRLVAEIFAARHGSALDSILTLYDESGRILAVSDDQSGTTDSRLEITLPAAGRYFLGLQDAHDRGGPAHPYRLVVQGK